MKHQAHEIQITGHALRRGVAAALIAVVLASCGTAAATPSNSPVGPGPSGQPSQPSPTAAGSATPYATLAPGQLEMARGNAALAAPAADRGAAAAAEMNDFGFDLLRNLDANGNLVASPTSIALALGMIRPGARGQTAAEMDKVLHAFGADGQESEIRAMLEELASQNVFLKDDGSVITSPDPAKDAPTVELSVADEAFIQNDLQVEPAYLDSLTSAYNAGVALVDYKNNTEAARLLINQWASDQTRGRIPNILQQGDIDGSTRLVLVNAIYLKAAWDTEFDPSQTANRAFTTAGGKTVQVPTMAIDAKYEYAAGAGYQAIDLPYAMNGLSMTVIVPDDMASFIGGLSDSQLKAILGAESEAEVDLQLPKFSIETRVGLADVLSGMGMGVAFDPNAADFSGITTQEPLYVGAVIHQANIDVVEKGTTAAAVTAVVMEAGAAPVQPRKVTFHVDKPFLYFIHDNRSGAVLFMGRVDDPSAK
jgi:serpin B